MTYTVAVCDDEQTQIDILKNNLIKYSIDTDIEFFIDEYISGELLIEKYKSVKSPYDIIFLDMEMPDIKGLDVAVAIRELPDRNVSIAFVTSYPEYMQDSFDVQTSQYIIKPVVYEQMAKKLDISKIDNLLNDHSTGKGLGENFPVADRVENKTLISTKSIDLGSKTYLDPEKLSKRIETCIEQLEGFEDKCPKVKKDGLKWGKDPITKKDRVLKVTDYTSKQLELALPDIPITEEQASIINLYAMDYNISIVIVRG